MPHVGHTVRVGYVVDAIAPLMNVRAQIRLGRLLGADDLWFGDHTAHVLPNSFWTPGVTPLARLIPRLDAWFDPTVLIARYARRNGPRMGVSVTDPIRRSAADLARAWLSLHHVTGGKVVLGIGAGEAMNLKPIGEEMSHPVARLEDTVSAIRAAWASNGRPVTHRGRFHSWEGAGFLPPYRGSTPPIWVAAEGPRACRVAGVWGDGWISFKHDFQEWRSAADAVATAALGAGRDPAGMALTNLMLTVLVSDRARLEEACASPLVKAIALLIPAASWAAAGLSHPLGDDFSGSWALDPTVFDEDGFREATRAVTPEAVERLMPCGTAPDIARRIAPFVHDGLSQVIIVNMALLAGSRPSRSGLQLVTQAIIEQRALTRLLKAMRPGRFGCRPASGGPDGSAVEVRAQGGVDDGVGQIERR